MNNRGKAKKQPQQPKPPPQSPPPSSAQQSVGTSPPVPPASPKNPRWPKTVIEYTADVAEQFKRHLKEIAHACAKHDKSEYVCAKHVDQAFEALERTGLTHRKAQNRPEVEFGIGVAFLTTAGSVPDYITGLFPLWSSSTKDGWETGIMVTMILTGCFLMGHAWIRGTGIR